MVDGHSVLTGGAALEPHNYMACEEKTMKDRKERRNNLDLHVGARSKCIEFQGSMLNFVFTYLLHFSSKLTFLVCRDTWHQVSRTGFWL